MSGDTADLIERAAKRKDALEAARLAALDGDYGPARELARIEEAEAAEAAEAADLADGIGKAKTGRELAKLAPPAKVSELCLELGVTKATIYRYVAPDGSLRDRGRQVPGSLGGPKSGS